MPDTDLPLWYEVGDNIVCEECKAETLRDWSPQMVEAKGGTEDEMVRPKDFRALGRRPWAGSDEGDRYMQCDFCQGQWGPDA